MATFQDGGRKRATANTITSARRNAVRRTCPLCERKSAIVRDAENRMTYCRWSLEFRPETVKTQNVVGTKMMPLCTYYKSWDDDLGLSADASSSAS